MFNFNLTKEFNMKNNYFLALLFVLLWSTVAIGQTIIKGKVTDAETREALVGATVQGPTGTVFGSITDLEGNYIVNVPEGATTLVFSYTGYTTQQIEIAGRSVIDVSLVEGVDIETLVLVGYAVEKKANVTGAIAEVGAKELEDMQIGRLEQALQGRTSGVRITQGSGAPGSGSVIRIRGTSSINGANPLYVVDGVVIGGGIDFLNPNDIESISVLKDAASAAIYGARGANGVVIVKTKGGQAGKMRINYNAYYGVQNPWKKVSLLNAREYAILQNEMAAAAGQAIPFPNPDQYGEGTDWQDEVFYYNAPIKSNELNISGGSEKTTYYSSVSYFQQEGIVAQGKSNYSRLSARLNTESQVNEKVKFGMNIAYTYTESQGVSDNSEFGSPLGRALNIDPITPLYEDDAAVLAQAPYSQNGVLRSDLVQDENGIFGISNYVTSEILNPVAASAIINSTNWAHKFVPSVYGEIEIIKNLKVKSNFGGDLAFWGNNSFTPAYYLNTTNIQDTNSVAVNFNNGFTWIWDNTISYNFELDGGHKFTVLGGHSAQMTNGRYFGGSKRDIPGQDPLDATIDYARNENSEQVYGGKWERSSIESYLSRVNYNFNDKYIVTAIMRADASSNFGSNYRWGYFPSVSAAWNVNEEAFWGKNDKINTLKVRAGWGRNGNDAAGSLEYVSTIGGNRSYTFGTGDVLTNGAAPDRISNPDLRWETVEQINLGADARFFQAFTLGLDFFIKNTFDMKAQPQLPAYIGNTPSTANIGNMKNSGIDLELGFSDEIINGFDLSVNANVSYIQNEVVLIGNETGFQSGQRWSTQSIEVTRTTEGLPIGYLFGYTIDGIFQNQDEINAHVGSDGLPLQPNAKPGDFRFVDVNKDGTFDENDRGMIGDPTPTWTYGFTLNAAYKGFDLVVFGQGVAGNDIFNATRRYDLPKANMSGDALERWTGENTSTTYPRLTFNDQNINFARSSTFYVESGAFFRIKTAQLGYSLPMDLIKAAGMGKARVYVAANNLLTFTKYSGFDPEIGSGVDFGIYPQARTFSVGVNITFE
jgi:TonB-dependent starch-binding outer membrane protein SusC